MPRDSDHVKIPRMHKAFKGLLLGLALLFLPWRSSAQTAVQAVLSAPNIEAYPTIRAYLTVQDGEGRFLSGLTSRDIAILENGQEVPVTAIEEQTPGALITVAINPSPAFAVRDSTGQTRYDQVVAALNAWADRQDSSSQDELGLIMTGVQTTARVDSYADFRDSLAAAPTDHRNAVTNLSTLATAIELANDPAARPGMGRTVLFITPQADIDTIDPLANMILRANQGGVRVFVWMVTSEAYFDTNGARALQEMAEATGGRLFAFSGTETLPDPDAYFDPLRKIYSLTYESSLRSSGEFEIAARILKTGYEADSAPVPLALIVLPPNPIFVAPPTDIYRSLVPDAEGNLSAEIRTPLEQSVEILIEFPDGYPRALARTTLYVNGEIADENTAPPFDRFTWNLDALSETGRYMLQVEALDELGLSSISLETAVDVTVQQMPEGFVPAITRNSPLIVTVVVVLVGGVMIGVLLRVRKLRPAPNSVNRRRRAPADPVYQPVETEVRPSAASRGGRWANRLHWPQRSIPRGEPVAFLERIADSPAAETSITAPPLAIHTTEVTLGTDPSQATFVLDDPSVAGLHARLYRNLENEFYVSDFGSIAGTYINYLPINGSLTRLEHGDIIHFGLAGFRFRLNPAPQIPLPSIEPEESQP